ELVDRTPLRVTEEREARAEPGAERRRHRGRIDADRGEMAIVHVELVLEFRRVVPQLARALRSPVAAIEGQDERKLARERRDARGLAEMIGKLEVREPAADDEIGVHRVPPLGNREPVYETRARTATLTEART